MKRVTLVSSASLAHRGSKERREIGVCPDPRVHLVARVTAVFPEQLVQSALPVHLDCQDPKDPKDLKVQKVHRARKETQAWLDLLALRARPER